MSGDEQWRPHQTDSAAYHSSAAVDALLSWRAVEVIAPFGPHYPTKLNGFQGCHSTSQSSSAEISMFVHLEESERQIAVYNLRCPTGKQGTVKLPSLFQKGTRVAVYFMNACFCDTCIPCNFPEFPSIMSWQRPCPLPLFMLLVYSHCFFFNLCCFVSIVSVITHSWGPKKWQKITQNDRSCDHTKRPLGVCKIHRTHHLWFPISSWDLCQLHHPLIGCAVRGLSGTLAIWDSNLFPNMRITFKCCVVY